jgi:hypothetical protein
MGVININIIENKTTNNDYLDMLSHHGFKSFTSINVYIRTPINARHTCIDHIFVKYNDEINNFQVGVLQSNFTDHFSTVLAIPKYTKIKNPFIKTVNKINYDEVISKLKTEDWAEIYLVNDVNKSCDLFYNKINSAIISSNTTKIINSKEKRIKEG